MTQENKELLFKDLCARLPYGVKCEIIRWSPDGETVYVKRNNSAVKLTLDNFNYIMSDDFHEVKPYLFPLSSMTRAQREEFVKFADYEPRLEDCGRHQELYYYDLVGHENNLYPNSDAIDWLDKNHFDYRGLIPKDLAIDATNLNIY